MLQPTSYRSPKSIFEGRILCVAEMAAALQEKREVVHRMLDEAVDGIKMIKFQHPDDLGPKTGQVFCKFCRHRREFMSSEVHWSMTISTGMAHATNTDWLRVLSEGLGASFIVDWAVWSPLKHSRKWRVFRVGKPIFEVLGSLCLNPAWDGTSEEDPTL